MKRVGPPPVGKETIQGKQKPESKQKNHIAINDVKYTTDTENTMRRNNAKLCPGVMSLHLFECAAIVQESR